MTKIRSCTDTAKRKKMKPKVLKIVRTRRYLVILTRVA